ncbi:hypothetical protein K469DRAFT_564671 [Zopfia rhizophila CBS 207.26]|uniref:Isopenicillin N synthase-like Fe(2+) 2OG dioxygenase domain-containing protein n=1 Tax=Zopfia rhizophila CBS 207.26 TaxID=1314779 RepID=A0A6A6EF85_9PEZI|nr:hypothetical protein K469DRAFT_564671 [Zopfia rhizophila CBS 207.26]
MAAVAPQKSHDSFSISNLISRFRSKRKRNSADIKDYRQPLHPSPLPLVLPEHQQTLSNLGWTTVTFPQSNEQTVNSDSPGSHPLKKAYEDLFDASKRFFNLPDSEKEKWKTKLGSEEGWSKIPGEKEFITLRTLAYTPDVLKEAAKKYWDVTGDYLEGALGRVSLSLGMEDGEGEGGLRRFVGPCKRLGGGEGDVESEEDEGKTATMLRLFKYEGDDAKVVAEPHADLGLLSLVIGDTPGLEVWNGYSWLPIEQTYTTPSATLLAGHQLERLSNYRYPAGGHRVVSYGSPDSSSAFSSTPNYRFSIVFVLRAHERVMVNTDALTTNVTGPFQKSIKGITAGKMFEQIRNAHFNINTGLEEREEQKRKIAEKEKVTSKRTE